MRVEKRACHGVKLIIINWMYNVRAVKLEHCLRKMRQERMKTLISREPFSCEVGARAGNRPQWSAHLY